MRRILFVCTGNTCRSPMAEAIAKYLLNKNGIEAHVESRGIYADCRGRISRNALETLKNKYGLDASQHEPRQLIIDDLDCFDIILTMTSGHKYYIFDNFKGFNDKVLTLKEFAENIDGDISDPFGADLDVYVKCASEIEGCLYKLFEKVAGE